MATKEEVRIIITELSAAFPDWKPPDPTATLRAYQDALSRFPADLIRKAACRCRDSCLYFPKIAEIRRAIGELTANPNTFNPANDFKKVPPSPEMRKFLDAFRQRMVDSGQWKDGHRQNRSNERQCS